MGAKFAHSSVRDAASVPFGQQHDARFNPIVSTSSSAAAI